MRDISLPSSQLKERMAVKGVKFKFSVSACVRYTINKIICIVASSFSFSFHVHRINLMSDVLS